MAIEEYKEYFTRHEKVTTGSTPDKETGLIKTYLVGGVSKFMTFLRNDVPSEIMYKKLFASITFKLNKEDRATTSKQGLVKKALDSESEVRTLNPSTDFTKAVVSHQLPEIVLTTDGSDTVVGSPIEQGGLKLSVIKRTISALFRRNYKIEVNVLDSIEIDSTTKKLHLVGDSDAPGVSMFYGTHPFTGAKGWYSAPSDFEQYLSADFPKVNSTLAPLFSVNVVTEKIYKFEAWLFVDPQVVGGWKIDITGTATANNIIYEVHYMNDSTDRIDFKSRVIALGTTTGSAGQLAGVILVRGTIKVNASGTLNLRFAQSVTNASSSIIKQGSTFLLKSLIPTA